MNTARSLLPFLYIDCRKENREEHIKTEDNLKDVFLDFRETGNLSAKDLGLIVRSMSSVRQSGKKVKVVAETGQENYLRSKLNNNGYEIHNTLDGALNTYVDGITKKKIIDYLRK